MSLTKVHAGNNVPHDINVIIEIPQNSDPVKYEVDEATGTLVVNRFMGTGMRYPCNYGYLPHSLGEDGDPVDVLVVAPAKLLSGCVVSCRPIGMLEMSDEAGRDAKVLAVPTDGLTPLYQNVSTFRDMPGLIVQQIRHFFEHYKDLEPGKWVKVEGWLGPEEAKAEILKGIARFKNSNHGEC